MISSTKFRRAALRSLRHPDWILESARARLRADRSAGFAVSGYTDYVHSAEEATCALLSTTPEAFRLAVTAAWWPPHPLDHQAGPGDLAPIMRGLVRIVQPEVVVETGVARGVTSATILQAMDENQRGRLHSLDLPDLAAGTGYTGSLVPDRLRARWDLTLGPSRRELPRLLERVQPVDIFLHDADHSYQSQSREYAAAWPSLRPGGLLVSDDVRNPAFVDFARAVSSRPYLVARSGGRDAVGLLRKPADGAEG